MSCLNIFEKVTDKARSKLLDLTDSNQLRHRWVESCDKVKLHAVVESIASKSAESLAKKLDLLEICSENLKSVIEKSLNEKENAEFEMLKVLNYAGRPAEDKTAIEKYHAKKAKFEKLEKQKKSGNGSPADDEQ